MSLNIGFANPVFLSETIPPLNINQIWAKPVFDAITSLTSLEFYVWNGTEWQQLKGEDGESGLVGTLRGVWSNAVNYEIKDVVYHNASRSSYIAVNGNTASEPALSLATGLSTNADWFLVARGGLDGIGGGLPDIPTPDLGYILGSDGANEAVWKLESDIVADVSVDDVTIEKNIDNELSIKEVPLVRIETIIPHSIVVNDTNAIAKPKALAIGENEVLGRESGDVIGIPINDVLIGIATLASGAFTLLDARIDANSIVFANYIGDGSGAGTKLEVQASAGEVVFTSNNGSSTKSFNYLVFL